MHVLKRSAAMSITGARAHSQLGSFLMLIRWYSVVPLSLLAYAVALANGVERVHAATLTVAIACTVAAGYVYNDLCDQRADRINRPARVLVAGQLSPKVAARSAVALLIVSAICVLATRSTLAIVFITLLMLSVWLYSIAVKRVAGLKNVFVALWCGLLPWGAALETVSPATVLPSVMLVALFVMQKELVADVYDRTGDAAAGLRTIPIVTSARTALLVVAGVNATLWMVSGWAPASGLPHLADAARVVAQINVLLAAAVALKESATTVRAYLELQKSFQVGGCIALCAALISRLS